MPDSRRWGECTWRPVCGVGFSATSAGPECEHFSVTRPCLCSSQAPSEPLKTAQPSQGSAVVAELVDAQR